MKKKNCELARIERLIKKDRLSVKDDFSQLLKTDLHRVLQDYFDYKGLPLLYIERTGDGYTVKVLVAASGVKPFSVVPSDGYGE